MKNDILSVDSLAADPWPPDLGPPDLWTARARPAFLYVMYALLLWSVPMGLIAGVRPDVAAAITKGMAAYLNALPEPLYALFGTGYLGYTAARAWGKAKGVER
ncbi:MAG: 3TM-type holin [bacterium]|nr:3TM-type holin [bacterium]